MLNLSAFHYCYNELWVSVRCSVLLAHSGHTIRSKNKINNVTDFRECICTMGALHSFCLSISMLRMANTSMISIWIGICQFFSRCKFMEIRKRKQTDEILCESMEHSMDKLDGIQIENDEFPSIFPQHARFSQEP